MEAIGRIQSKIIPQAEAARIKTLGPIIFLIYAQKEDEKGDPCCVETLGNCHMK